MIFALSHVWQKRFHSHSSKQSHLLVRLLCDKHVPVEKSPLVCSATHNETKRHIRGTFHERIKMKTISQNHKFVSFVCPGDLFNLSSSSSSSSESSSSPVVSLLLLLVVIVVNDTHRYHPSHSRSLCVAMSLSSRYIAPQGRSNPYHFIVWRRPRMGFLGP